MQQDTAKMQADRKLPEVRSFPFGANRQDLHHVGPSVLAGTERLIIDKYLGIPYKHRGRTREGLDCWGFLKLFYADLGIKLFDVEDLEYSRVWGVEGKDYFKAHYFHDWVEVKEPEVLDGVLFVNSRGIANHAGIVLSKDRFMHCCRQGVIISRINDPRWLARIEGFYRLKE